MHVRIPFPFLEKRYQRHHVDAGKYKVSLGVWDKFYDQYDFHEGKEEEEEEEVLVIEEEKEQEREKDSPVMFFAKIKTCGVASLRKK